MRMMRRLKTSSKGRANLASWTVCDGCSKVKSRHPKNGRRTGKRRSRTTFLQSEEFSLDASFQKGCITKVSRERSSVTGATMTEEEGKMAEEFAGGQIHRLEEEVEPVHYKRPLTLQSESYYGLWREDQPNGHGVFRWFSGDIYMGEWQIGRFEHQMKTKK
eukprot:753676-Hanusia_phi.AAC.14